MCKWEELGVSKEIFEACERLAKVGLSDEIKTKVNECVVKKADISELCCNNKIVSGDIDTTSVFIDGVPLEEIICHNNEKSVFQEVLECVTNELSDELWQTVEEAEDEEILCLECLVKYYLERSYSEGFKNGLKSIKNRIDNVKDELLE